MGHGEDELPAARPRHRAPHPRRAERAWARSTSCWPPAASAARAAATRRSPARATARAGASTGRSATSSPARATSRTPSTAPTSPASGASTPTSCPRAGVDAYEIFRKIDRGEIRGLLSICFNPMVSLPDNDFIARMLEKLEFYVAIDFFLNETAQLRRRRAARLAARGGRGHRHQRRGPGHQDQQGRRLPRRGPAGLADHPGPRRGAGPPARVHVRRARARSSTSCAGVAPAASPTTPASPTRRSSGSTASSGPARATTTPARRGCSSRARGTRSPRAQGRSTSPTARPASTSPPTRRRPRTWTTSIR